MHSRARDLIATLDLRPHPEGGYYREVFRSVSRVMPHDARGPRAALTTIYFMLTAHDVSRWHQVSSDEVWHLCEGGPLVLHDLDLAARRVDRFRLTTVSNEDAQPLHVIPAGHWQAARSLGPYALMACTVGPGFDFSDFRLMADDSAAMSIVRAEWPELAAWI